MFAPHTVLAIIALASVDAGVSLREKDALSDFLNGRVRVDDVPARYASYMTYSKAAKALNVSLPTVKRMAKRGTLEKVRLTGDRAVGVTPRSVMDLISKRNVKC